MGKAFSCKNVGISCDWEDHAETEEELLKKIAEHGATHHDIKEISEEMRAKIQAAIRDE